MPEVPAKEIITEAAENQGTSPAAGQEFMELMAQLMKPEVQESLIVLLNDLPKLVEMTTVLSKGYDVAKNLATDDVLIEDLKGGMEEFVRPLQDNVKGLASAVIEASDRAKADTTVVSPFALWKMLKDPQVQKALRFSQAFLKVLNERG